MSWHSAMYTILVADQVGMCDCKPVLCNHLDDQQRNRNRLTNPFTNMVINKMWNNLGQVLPCLLENLLECSHSCVLAHVTSIDAHMK